jgi:hypothetical protein
MVPAASQTLLSRAMAASAVCSGPLPASSQMATLSPSFLPIRQKYSGNTTKAAPAAAACATSTAARARLAATSVPDTICTAAAINFCFMA